MPKYLIIGGAGFIGSHLVDRLSPSEAELVDQPYAASQLSAELIGRTYSHLYGLTFVALRLFTV